MWCFGDVLEKNIDVNIFDDVLQNAKQVEVLLVRVINHCIAPPGLRFLPLLYFERFPATKIQAQEPCRAELRSYARDANNTPDHLKEAKFNSVSDHFPTYVQFLALPGGQSGLIWLKFLNLVNISEIWSKFLEVFYSFLS